MVIAPCSSVHTFFMQFPIDVIFVRRDGRIRKIAANVAPWRLAGSIGAFAVIELAAGAAQAARVERGQTLLLTPDRVD